MHVNPFFFETPSDRWNFTDREELMKQLQELMREKVRRVLVFGRRRMGKTSLIRNAAEKAKVTFVSCDVSTAANTGELARKLLDAAPAEKGARLAQALTIASRFLKSVSIEAGKVTLAGELRNEDAVRTLGGVLGTLNERAAGNGEVWTVCFDEFQELRALGGDRIDWQLRGLMQEHRHLNYLFTGSDHRIVGWMTEPGAPFFKQLHQIRVGPIDPAHLAGWLADRARRGGLADFPHGEEIVRHAGPCTGDVVRLAKSVFTLAAGGAKKDVVATAFDVIAGVELNTEFLSHWRSLPVSQRAVLRAIAAGRAPTATDTLREFGLNAASTASKAVEALVERQFLVRDESGLIFDNPFFRRWVELNGVR